MSRSFLSTAGKYVFGFGLLALVVWWSWAPTPTSAGLGAILQRPVQVGPLALAASILLTSLLLSFVRWYFLVRALDLPFTLTNAIRLGLIGYFWSTMCPGSVGGDIVKAHCIAREQKRRSVAVASVLIDRAVGLWALVWFVALFGSVFWLTDDPALLAQPMLQHIVTSAIGLVALTSVMWGILILLPERRAEKFAWRLGRIPIVGGAAAEFWRAVWMYRGRQRSVALALGLALVGHVGWVLTFYFAARTFVAPADLAKIPSLTEHFLIVPFGMTGSAFIPTPGAVGGAEAIFATLYELVGKSRDFGIAGSLAQRAITLAVAMIGYLTYLRMPSAERVSGSWSGSHDLEPRPKLAPSEAAVA